MARSVTIPGFAQNPVFQSKVARVVRRHPPRRSAGSLVSLSCWGLPRVILGLWAVKIALVVHLGSTGYAEALRPMRDGPAPVRAVAALAAPDVITQGAVSGANMGRDLIRRIGYAF